MSKDVLIDNWEGLVGRESETHYLDIDLRFGCGWIRSKNVDADRDEHRYLSTHSFYESQITASNNLLKKCGFNIKLIS